MSESILTLPIFNFHAHVGDWFVMLHEELHIHDGAPLVASTKIQE